MVLFCWILSEIATPFAESDTCNSKKSDDIIEGCQCIALWYKFCTFYFLLKHNWALFSFSEPCIFWSSFLADWYNFNQFIPNFTRFLSSITSFQYDFLNSWFLNFLSNSVSNLNLTNRNRLLIIWSGFVWCGSRFACAALSSRIVSPSPNKLEEIRNYRSNETLFEFAGGACGWMTSLQSHEALLRHTIFDRSIHFRVRHPVTQN